MDFIINVARLKIGVIGAPDSEFFYDLGAKK